MQQEPYSRRRAPCCHAVIFSIRPLCAPFSNDFDLQNVTPGEIQTMHDDVNRVQEQNTELEARIATLERLLAERAER